MADFSMYGPAENGVRLYQQDAMKEQLQSLAIQEGQQNLQQNKIRQAIELNNLRLQQQHQQELNQIMMRDQNASNYDIGNDLIRSGMVKEGTAVLDKAAQADQRFATADKAREDTALKKLQYQQNLISHFSGMLDSAASQDDYNNIVSQTEQMTGQRLPDNIRNARFSPEVKKRLQDYTMSLKDKKALELKQFKEMQDARSKEVTNRLREAQISQTQAREQADRVRTERMSKDNKVTSVPSSEVKAAFNLIKQDFPGVSMDDPDTANASYYIASKARELLANNRGLDSATALQQAKQQAKAEGLITNKTATVGHFFGSDEEKVTGPKFSEKAVSRTPSPPSVGTVMQGYRFKGGDPSKQENWEKV